MIDLIESEYPYESDTPAFDSLWREKMIEAGKSAALNDALAKMIYCLGGDGLTTG